MHGHKPFCGQNWLASSTSICNMLQIEIKMLEGYSITKTFHIRLASESPHLS